MLFLASHSNHKTLKGILGCLILLLSLSSCENDLKDVERISSQIIEEPVDISYGVTVIYSDSAIVKAKMTSPEMKHFNTAEPYYEFPQGGLLILFDKDGNETERVNSEYAIQRENTGITELRKNVVVTRSDGLVIKSDELIWDDNKKIFYSNLPVTLIRNGTEQHGTSFWANEDFSLVEATSLVGDFNLGKPDSQYP
jgi:LPS export ABC transporter protein LptC